jgi:catechol 2,3-dioxygenase-like lactoylglutathione lyase family enzyme
MSSTISPTRTQPSFRRLSSVLLVDRIEPCLEFWVDRLGFEIRLKIDGEDHIEFVALGHGDAEIMYRTRDSVNQESPGLVDGDAHQPWVVIYLEVDDLDNLLPRLDGIEVIVPLRETILGTREIFFREPSGRILALSSRN